MPLDVDTRTQLLDTIARFVAERLRPIEAEVAENDAIPEPVIEDMKALGLFGLSIPEDYGGLGLSMEDEALVAMEMGHASPAFRSAFGTNVGIGSQGLVMFGTEAQKQKWLPGIASGGTVTSFALTEPEAGSDSAAVQTRARFVKGEGRDVDHYVLDGSKRYITNAGRASLFTVMARTDPDKKGAAGVSAFLVPRDLPGLTIGKPEKKMGQQGAHIHDVIFEGVRVPAENRLGEEGEGFKVAMQVLDRGRLHIAAVCVGVAERLIKDCVAYAGERRQFGQAIASFQMVQAMIADAKTEALAARALVLETARRRDAGESVTLEASASKLFASEMVGRVADRAVQIFGGAGYVADYGIERLYRDVRIFRIYEGSSEIQKLVIARETMKRGG
jgi:acyl-CoA dehydrogenase